MPTIYQAWVTIEGMIVVYGTVCLDRVYRVPNLPALGGYVEISDAHTFLGGEASNTAAALALWGDDPILVGNPLGVGQDAELLTSLLRSNNILSSHFPVGEQETPACHILVTPEGERTMFGLGFKDMEKRGDPSLVPYEQNRWLTADSNHGALARTVVRNASIAGMHTYLMDFVQEVNLIPEGCWWQSSTSWAGGGNGLAWLAIFAEQHKCHAILTDGARGLYVAGPEGKALCLPAFPIGMIVDSTGAGDVFRAGMLHGLSRDWPRSECLKFASAAGALNCKKLGATCGLASESDIQQFIAEFPSIASAYDQSE